MVAVSSEMPDWGQYLGQHADATVLHEPRWGRVMLQAYASRPYYLTARRGDKTVGVLQLVHQKSLMFGSYLCGMPYFDGAGILADDAGARESLTREAESLRKRVGAGWVEIRQFGPIGDSLPARTDKVTMWLPLQTGSQAMWEFLKTKVRTKVRKSQKMGLTVLEGQGELLEDFFEIYSRAMRDLGSPPHSRRFFQLIVEEFGPAVKLFSVRSEHLLLAASLTLVDRQGFHVPWSGSDRRYSELSANRLMYWSMLASACDSGSKLFDFGRSTRGSGTYEFKKEWGAQEVQLYWHYLLPPGRQPPDLRPDSAKYRMMVACWRRLPLGLARFLGPRIIGKLS